MGSMASPQTVPVETPDIDEVPETDAALPPEKKFPHHLWHEAPGNQTGAAKAFHSLIYRVGPIATRGGIAQHHARPPDQSSGQLHFLY